MDPNLNAHIAILHPETLFLSFAVSCAADLKKSIVGLWPAVVGHSFRADPLRADCPGIDTDGTIWELYGRDENTPIGPCVSHAGFRVPAAAHHWKVRIRDKNGDEKRDEIDPR